MTQQAPAEMSGVNREIAEVLARYRDFQHCEVQLVKDGFNRAVYSLKDSAGHVFIAKLGRTAKDPGSSIAKEAVILRFLQEQGVFFVPEILLWDKGADFSIESHIGSRDVSFKQLHKPALTAFTSQLHQVHALPIAPLQHAARNAGIQLHTSELEQFKVYGLERFNIAKKLCPDPAVISWLEEKLAVNYRMITEEPARQLHLVWGDIGENLRTDGQRLFFVDWEHAHIGRGSELAYIKIHSHAPPRKFAKIVAHYAQASGIPEHILRNEIAHDERIIRVNDVVWAAMKWGQASSAAEAARYKKLAYTRRDQANRVFAEG